MGRASRVSTAGTGGPGPGKFLSVVVAAGVLLASGTAPALVINDDFTFSTTGQSMWSEGGASVFKKEVFLGTRWGTYAAEPGDKIPPPLTLQGGAIVGEANVPVPGTGGTIPNPARIAYDVAFAACDILHTASQCINGIPAVRACAPSWLGGGCVTVVPALPGLGNPPPAEIPNPIGAQFIDTRTGAEGGLASSGEAGIIPWINASGGSIDVKLPVGTTLTLPDAITSGTPFTVTTRMAVKNGLDPEITANAPSFKAGVDGIINMENTFFGTACVIPLGCATDEQDVDILPGRFGILNIDTTQDNFLRVFGEGEGVNSLGVPGIAFNTQYLFFAPTPENPDGVDDEVTPKKTPSPRLGDITVGNLHNFTGGAFDGTELALTTNQTLLSVNVSVTGVSELFLGSPGILSNKVELIKISPFPAISLEYTLLDIGVGPRFGMQQDFGLTPDAWVRLEFDQPVTRVSDGMQFDDGIVEVELGEDIDLLFPGATGNLIKRTFFMKEPKFENATAATIDPGLKIEAGCLSGPIIGLDCLFREDFATTGLLAIPVYENEWNLGGFNEVSLLGLASTGVGADDPRNAAIPEPATVVLLGIGMLLLGFARNRRGELARVDC
jgi:PEP-CTERM motif-containing protein